MLPYFYRERVETYISGAHKALLRKTAESVDDGDLFAIVLLTLLSCQQTSASGFELNLRGFMSVLRELSGRRNGWQDNFCLFWPLARDLILQGSRRLGYWNYPQDAIIHFYRFCQSVLGSQRLIPTADYMFELYGFDAKREYAFCQSVWHYSVVLRICFRQAVYRQIRGLTGLKASYSAVVSDIEGNLNVAEIRELVTSLYLLKARTGANMIMDSRIDLLMFTLLVHQFCRHLIILLQATTVFEGAASVEGIISATSLFDLIQPEWSALVAITPYTFYPRSLSRYFVPRASWVAGLSFHNDKFSQSMDSKVQKLIRASSCKYYHVTRTKWSVTHGRRARELLVLSRIRQCLFATADDGCD